MTSSRFSVLWIVSAVCLAALVPGARAADNELTAEEKTAGVTLLFDGKDLKGWHRVNTGSGGWHVEDGALCLREKGGMLYTDGEYDNFVLKIDFKMGKGCNSGVFLRVGDPRDEVQTGLEIQVLDDAGKPPSRHSCGAIYDLVAPSKVVTRPAGEWNSYVITADKNLITVELNGEKIARINLDEWDRPGQRPDGSQHKFRKPVKDFPRRGPIGLQDHNRPVWFKNIKLKVLD